MKKRPISITVLSFIFIAAGAAGLIYHLKDFRPQQPFQSEVIWISLVRILAIVGGVFMFLGRNWARWLCLVWLAFHVVISIAHPMQELAFHAAIFVAITILLLRRDANEYFRTPKRDVATET